MFDPSKIRFEDLLAEFWKSHDAAGGSGPRQYRNVILFTSEAQRISAEATREAATARLGRATKTAIEPLHCFWPAEEYHQKYYLQGRKDILAELKAAWPGQRWYLSTSAARFNAFVSGAADAGALSREIERFALADGLKARLAEALDRK